MSKALQNSKGAAKRTADIMRNTAAGAWDNLTGSVETAAIKITSVAMPALKDVMNRLAEKVNVGTGTLGAFMSGVSGKPVKGKASVVGAGVRAGIQGKSKSETAGFSGAGKAGVQVGGVLRTIGDQAAKLGPILLKAGSDLLAAFAPAMPFFTNVLLPLFKGIVVGVLGGVVFAFKLLVPIIKIVATALGFIGKAAAPLKPVFFGIGVVIGALLGGPILGLLGKLKYVGIIFRLMAVPIRLVSAAFGLVTGAIVRVGGAFLKGLTFAQRFAGTFTSMPGRLIRAALNIVGGIVHTIETLPGKLLSVARGAGSRIISGLSGGVRSRIGSLVAFFGRIGKQILDALVNAIKAAPGVIVEAIKSILPGGKLGKKLADAVGLATGGTVSRSGWAVVGERGPELTRLPRGSTVYDSKQTARARGTMASSGPTTIVANLHLSGRQIHSEVFRVDQQLQEAT
jgi:hypothetical protein